MTSQPQGDGQLHEVRLGRTVSAVWRSTATGGFGRGEIRFGGQAVMPAEPGLRLAGSGRGLDISGWVALLPKGDGKEALPLSSIDLSFDALDLMGRRYQDVRLQGRTRNGLLRTQVTGRELNGVLTYRPAGAYDSTGASARSGSESIREQPARVSAQFRQLTIPACGARDRQRGRHEHEGRGFSDAGCDGGGFSPAGTFAGTAGGGGARRAAGAGDRQPAADASRQRVPHERPVARRRAERNPCRTESEGAGCGQVPGRFGYPDALKRGSADIQGNATWVGSPADFAFDTLAGQLDFKARSGQFLKVDPGAGKLLGVLSLQSLPRRLSFDFRDIFNEGYAFDDISATLRIARGVVYSDDFRMRGPAAKVNMSGLADLNQESVQLRVKVIPKLSEGVAVAGALIGGPLAGVGALAAQKLLRDPFEEAISQEYMVTGAWQAPDVKKLTKTKNLKPVSEP